MKPQTILRSVAILWAMPALLLAQTAVVSPKAGDYSGTASDGSSFHLTLAKTGDIVQVKEVGYRFIPTGITVNRVVMKTGQAFGKLEGNKLTFQFPVLLKFIMSNNIFQGGGRTEMGWYQAELKWGKAGELSCTLTEVKQPAREYEDKFSIENIRFGPSPEGKSMAKTYSFVMKPVSQ